THNVSQPVSLAIAKFPKHVFVRFHATTTQHTEHKLTPHVDLFNILSEHIVCTRSYCRYTLQSFVVFTGRDGEGHYYTLANRKNECSDQPPNKDAFSIAVWNVFTNFTRCRMTLPLNLSLNDAADYCAKHDPLNNNPMNFAIL
ncbi:unnamed protein product, partial [Adineta ricciae]